MRILHINCNYIGTTLHQLMIEHLDALGYDNQVFVPTYDKNIAVIKPNDNVYVSECFRKWDRVAFDYKQHKIIKTIEEHYDVARFDLIHAYTLYTDGNAARVLSEKYGIPYVVAVRNTDVNGFLKKMIHLRKRGLKTLLAAKAVFFLSEAYRRQVFEKYVPQKYQEEIKKKTHIIPNGIDEFWFENTPEQGKSIDKEHIKLVYAGRIDKNKNIPTTQKAMEILRKQGYETALTVVGKVQDEKEFQIIKNDPYTTCIPAMPKEKLIDVYRASDIFVMPSHKESFGLVYAEAMSQGLPVVYTKGQGFDGQFAEGEVGFATSDKKPEELAECIVRICENYEKLSQNALLKTQKFKWGNICDEYKKIYTEIVRRKRKWLT